MPTCVEPGPEPDADGRPIGDPPVLVWVGSPSTVRHLTSIADALLEVHRSTGARLRVVGGSVEGGPLEAMASSEPWSAAAETDALSSGDLGLMPLPDGPLERGKCGYKLLQYGAAGLPAVASPVGINAEILESFGAPAPDTADDWVVALVDLIEAPVTTRAELGRRAHRVVTDQFGFDAWAPVWRRLVDDLGLST
ncbi:MAG: glycosyltransferase [Actinomycetota bacterium]